MNIVRMSMLVVLVMAAMSGYAGAEPEPTGIASALVDEDRARADRLFKVVRCPVCVGHSVAESDAEVSKSIRNYIEAEILSGRSDEEILENLVAAYGADILFSPRVSADTLFLWAAPLLFAVFGFGILWRIRQRDKQQRLTS